MCSRTQHSLSPPRTSKALRLQLKENEYSDDPFLFPLRLNQHPHGTRDHSHEAHLQKCDPTSADSGLQLDLEIALSGVPATVQPHELFRPAEDALKSQVT